MIEPTDRETVDRAVSDAVPRLSDDVRSTLHSLTLQRHRQRPRAQPVQTARTSCTRSPPPFLSIPLCIMMACVHYNRPL